MWLIPNLNNFELQTVFTVFVYSHQNAIEWFAVTNQRKIDVFRPFVYFFALTKLVNLFLEFFFILFLFFSQWWYLCGFWLKGFLHSNLENFTEKERRSHKHKWVKVRGAKIFYQWKRYSVSQIYLSSISWLKYI